MHTNLITNHDSKDLPRQTTTIHYVTHALKEKHFFKLVCGASLTDTEMIENLSFIFTLAGAHVIDLAPSANVILAARRGIERGIETARRRDGETANQQFAPSPHCPIARLAPRAERAVSVPLLMASIQLDKDPHFRKIEVDYNTCDLCGACVKVCPTEAFGIEQQTGEFIYSSERCYGCGICPSYCHVNALTLIDTKPTPKETLKEMISLGVKSIEFHFGKSYQKLEEIWHEVKDLVKQLELISFSIGSELLSNEEIKKAANLCYKLAGEGIILQCDGTPMSGGNKGKGNNSDNLSLQVAKIIQEEKLPVYLQISGGTNQNSYMRAIESGIDINGVAIGSYARKLLMPYINNLDNKENFNSALTIAKSLVNSVR